MNLLTYPLTSDAVIDFLIVRELVCTEQFSHSEEHDAVMEKIIPDYDKRDIEFHESCEQLIKQGWL
jgi:predicted metal-dependent hydrolase